jgi:hypothetical protein
VHRRLAVQVRTIVCGHAPEGESEYVTTPWPSIPPHDNPVLVTVAIPVADGPVESPHSTSSSSGHSMEVAQSQKHAWLGGVHRSPQHTPGEGGLGGKGGGSVQADPSKPSIQGQRRSSPIKSSPRPDEAVEVKAPPVQSPHSAWNCTPCALPL